MSFANVAIAGANAFSQVQSGKYAKGVANVQAGLMDYQAQVDNDNALKTAAIIRRAGRKAVGATDAAYAGAGVVVGQGSAGLVESDERYNVEHDAFQALLDGGRRANSMQTQAALTRIDGRMAQQAGYVRATGSVLGGVSKAAGASGWRTTGAPGFSGTQAPAPVTDLSTYSPGAR